MSVVRGIVKIAIGVGAGILAIVNRKRIKSAAGRVKNSVGSLFSGPDYSDKRAPHLTIDGLDKVEDYVYLDSDTDYVVRLSKRIEHDLRYILGYDVDDRMSLGELLGEAVDCNVFGDDEDLYNSINEFRMTRNKIVHGEGTQITFKFRLKWALAAFKLEESDESNQKASEEGRVPEEDEG